MIIHDCEQRTPEWFAARLGLLTGSRSKDAMAKPLRSGGEPASRRDYRVQLAVERLTGQSADSTYINAEMQHGIDKEPDARAAAELLEDRIVHQVGLVKHETLAAAASLDGYVGDFEGIIELKCPKSATHFNYWKAGVIPAEHLWQVIHNLWITGAQWCDFISFDDRFPAHLQLFRVRHERVQAEMDSYELLVRMFLAEVDRDVEAMLALVPAA